MLLLTSTSDLVEITTGGTPALHVQASYVDIAAGVINAGRTNTIISTATTTTVVGSPGASTQRNVKYLGILNTDASVSDVITVKHTDGTNVVTLQAITLLAGYLLDYNCENGWRLHTNTGGLA